ncbi:DUF305 domain-containing protein [Streptomyces sp. NPDC046887]|uniref:DUF305 domain-containing protein n=1 Tax=Streptomyces sp. NPDC046887 TaxID=3155472 RepID=UPI0033FB8612
MTARPFRRTLPPSARTRRAAGAAAALTAAALLLAGCGGADSTGSTGHSGHGATSTPAPSASASASADPGEGARNAADTAFAQGMIPHHRQAIAMAELARDRAGSAEVRALAAAIDKEQGPEIATLTGWLTAWGERVPAEEPGGHDGHEGGHAMAGMMSGAEMDRLERASGKAFDRAFLELMVRHHEGAVQMARTELAEGVHRPARTLAESVVASQSAEITRMRKLLDQS